MNARLFINGLEYRGTRGAVKAARDGRVLVDPAGMRPGPGETLTVLAESEALEIILVIRRRPEKGSPTA